MEATLLRILLIAYLAAAFVVAMFYLRHRRVTPLEYLFWGTLALALPALGPFFVIAARPGPRRRVRRPQAKKRVV